MHKIRPWLHDADKCVTLHSIRVIQHRPPLTRDIGGFRHCEVYIQSLDMMADDCQYDCPLLCVVYAVLVVMEILHGGDER
jgi:hypothetical protein